MLALAVILTALLLAIGHLLLGGGSARKALRPDEQKQPSLLEKLLAEAFELVPDGATGRRVLVLYGTEYGFSKEVALKLAARLAEAGLVPRIVNTLHYRVLDLTKERFLTLVCSTAGDGVPPNEAADFRDALVARDIVMPPGCRFAVLALGDRSYPHFCRSGIMFEELFGENRFLERVDIDQEDWPEIDDWIDAVVKAVSEAPEGEQPDEDYLRGAMAKYAAAMENQGACYTRNEPYMATLVRQDLLTAPRTGRKDEKEVVRVEFDITGSGLQYELGDAVGVVPLNNSEHVLRLLQGMACDGLDTVTVTEKSDPVKFEDALTEKLDIRYVKPELVHALVQKATDASETELAAKILGYDVKGIANHSSSSVTEWGKQYLADRDVLDVLGDFVSANLTPQELTDVLRPLHARYYSISSSSATMPDTIAATVDVLRYLTLETPREGVASTFLKDRCKVDETKVGVFVSKNTNFRLPMDNSKPIVMIGPGTGIAPFIGFVEERLHEAASGANWLFFGCRHETQDFLYGDRLKEYAANGALTLKTAFSRDGPRKVYVQHRMAECAEDLWQLIDKDGAHIYVCGDGGKMAEDVDAELRRIAGKHGNMSIREVENYVSSLTEAKRYQRDVWVS